MATITEQRGVVSYTLGLSAEEASALRRVLGRVSGYRQTTRRGLTQQIFDVLENIGVEPGDDDLEGGVEFK